jgi:hypothetical protein
MQIRPLCSGFNQCHFRTSAILGQLNSSVNSNDIQMLIFEQIWIKMIKHGGNRSKAGKAGQERHLLLSIMIVL